MTDYSNWMRDSLPVTGTQPLRNMTMPASHDAGMSSATNCGFGANVCNTKTQTQTIGGQLQAGIRYFDIRPTIYKQQMWTAHIDDGTGLGCNGQSLQSVLDDTSRFISRSGDLVILKFSHYYDRDSGTNGFTTSQMQQLIDMVSRSLQRYLFARPTTQGRGELCGFTMNDYIATRGVVLTVYDDLPANLWNARNGVYQYADVPGGNGDLNVYDHYSNTNDLNTMVTDQLAKLDRPENHTGNLFLLSWTLTLSTTTSVVDCQVTPNTPKIIDLAQSAINVLQQNMQDQFYAGSINATVNPNLLYTDACQSSITDTALWLINKFYGSSAAVS